MRLRLRTKLTLVMTGLVLLVAAVLCGVYVTRLMDQVLHETDQRSLDLARQVFNQAQNALTDAKQRGMRPSSSDPDETHDYVRRVFEVSDGLHNTLEGATDTPFVYEVSIVDKKRNGARFQRFFLAGNA